MRSSLSRSLVRAKRWRWAIILCIVLCGGITFVATTLLPKIYTAETALVINVHIPPSEEGTLISASILEPTFNQLIKSDPVLQPVAVRHGLTTAQLKAMVTTKPQTNTPVILIDVDHSNAILAAQLSYEVAKSFANYAIAQIALGTEVQFSIIKPTIPAGPSTPHPIQDALLAAGIGLVLALASIGIFEWTDGRFLKRKE